jgi:hypothetical protein
METRALKTIKFHDHLIPSLCDLYEDDSIFDKFTCSWSGMKQYNCSLQNKEILYAS